MTCVKLLLFIKLKIVSIFVEEINTQIKILLIIILFLFVYEYSNCYKLVNLLDFFSINI